jgi:hypothetical protein
LSCHQSTSETCIFFLEIWCPSAKQGHE